MNNEMAQKFKISRTYTRDIDYCKSPLRYPGGKFYALKFILPILNAVPHTTFYEPFFGGGSVFFGKRKSKMNFINDYDNDIVNFYKVIQNKNLITKFISLFDNEVATPQRHHEIKNFEPKNNFQRAYKTYYLNRTSYSGIINKPAWGFAVGASSPPQNWKQFLINAHKKLQEVKISNIDFRNYLLNINDNESITYIDPPYLNADQKRAYQKSFEFDDHVDLQTLLRQAKFKFILSYGDCHEIRNLYDWAYISNREWFYNTANSKGARKIGKELIITNFEFE